MRCLRGRRPRRTFARPTHWPWSYDPAERVITDSLGQVVATVSPALAVPEALTAGHLFAAAPMLWEALDVAHELGILWLAGYPRAADRVSDLEERIRELLVRINDATDGTES